MISKEMQASYDWMDRRKRSVNCTAGNPRLTEPYRLEVFERICISQPDSNNITDLWMNVEVSGVISSVSEDVTEEFSEDV